MKKRHLGGIGFYILLFIIVLVMFGIFNYEPGISSIPYSELLSDIQNGLKASITAFDGVD